MTTPELDCPSVKEDNHAFTSSLKIELDEISSARVSDEQEGAQEDRDSMGDRDFRGDDVANTLESGNSSSKETRVPGDRLLLVPPCDEGELQEVKKECTERRELEGGTENKVASEASTNQASISDKQGAQGNRDRPGDDAAMEEENKETRSKRRRQKRGKEKKTTPAATEEEKKGRTSSKRPKRRTEKESKAALAPSSKKAQKPNPCQHAVFFSGLCGQCGELAKRKADCKRVPLRYMHKQLEVCPLEMNRYRQIEHAKLLSKKKLMLVLDLDLTLLNSTHISLLSPNERYLLGDADVMQGDPKRTLFKLNSMSMIIKLRPFIHTFLLEASTMYDMCIYTMARRSYAEEMARLLDPYGVYFNPNSTVITKEDCSVSRRKGLDVTLVDGRTAVILDDTENVWWVRHKPNLIEMDRYLYFSSSCRIYRPSHQSLAASKIDERENDGALASILKVLRRVHDMFYDSATDTNFLNRDVRGLLQKVRQEVLQGCKVLDGSESPTSPNKVFDRVSKMCQLLGATCCAEVDPSVTHVICEEKGTQKARWAVENERYTVNSGWLEASFFLWRRMPEEDYQPRSGNDKA